MTIFYSEKLKTNSLNGNNKKYEYKRKHTQSFSVKNLKKSL